MCSYFCLNLVILIETHFICALNYLSVRNFLKLTRNVLISANQVLINQLT